MYCFVVEVAGLILKFYVTVASGTLLTRYQSARSHITQDLNPHTHRRDNHMPTCVTTDEKAHSLGFYSF